MWNQKDLQEPPVISYKAHKHDLDLTKLRNALQEGIKHFKDSTLLSSEAALLSRILYRMKMKFRSAKDFKVLEKLCRSLEIYFKTNMARHLKNILDMTPARYKIDTYLPTRNMLNYVLVRLQGLVKLMERIYDTCFIAATELNKRFSIGHFWKLFLILFSLVSRISMLVKYNTKTLCDLYGKLLPHTHRLENCGSNWLPDGYVLPTDLRDWLSVKWVYEDEFVDLTYEPVNEVMNFFNLVDDDEDDVQFCDEYILLDDEEKQIAKDFRNLEPLKESLSRNRMRGFSINEDDIGEEITDVIEINDTILDPRQSEDSLARVLNTIHEHEHSEDIGEELEKKEKLGNLSKTSSTTINISSNYRPQSANGYETAELLDDSGCSNDLNNRSIIDLVDETALNIEEDSVIIVSEHSSVPDNTVIVLDDTIKEEFLQSSNSKSKKKNKSTSKKLRSSSKENLQEVYLAEMNKSDNKKHDIPQYQTKTEAVAKRKLDFTEIASTKKIRKSLNPSPVKYICSNNNTVLTPKLHLTTTSQGENSSEIISNQIEQSLKGTSKKKKKLKLRSHTKVKDLMKKEYGIDQADNGTTFLFSSNCPIKENDVPKEEKLEFGEVASNSSDESHLRALKKVKKIKAHTSATKRKRECDGAISNKKIKKTGEQLLRPKQNTSLATSKKNRSRKNRIKSQKGDSDVNNSHPSKTKLRKKKAQGKKKSIVLQNDSPSSKRTANSKQTNGVLQNEITEHKEIQNKSSKKKKKSKKKQKQLQNLKPANSDQPTTKMKKNKSRRKKSKIVKKTLKTPAVLQKGDSKANEVTVNISKNKAQKLKRKIKGTQELKKLKKVCRQMIKILMKV